MFFDAGTATNKCLAHSKSPIPKAPKAQCASLGCDLIRSSNCHPDLTPGTTDAQIEPGPQKRVDHCCGAVLAGANRLAPFLLVLVIRRASGAGKR
jgi:hypothetical protein